MPRIKIISKLPKAQVGDQVNSIMQPPVFNPTGSFQSNWAWNSQGMPQQPYKVPKIGAWWENANDEVIPPPSEFSTVALTDDELNHPEYNGLPNPSTGIPKQLQGEDYDQPGYKGYKGPKKSSDFWGGLSKVNNTIDKVTTVGNVVLGYFDQRKKQKEYDDWMAKSMQPHNMYALDTRQNRGDYDVNDGIFRPNQMGYKSKGTQANPINAMSTFVKYGGLIKAEKGMELVPGDKIVNPAFLPDVSTSVVSASPKNYDFYDINSYLPTGKETSKGNPVEVLANVQAKLESGYDPTKPPTAKENIKAWNVPASKTIYGKWQISKDERKEAYKNLPELKNNFPTFQDYENAFLGKDTVDLQHQVQEITYKKFLAPRNLQLAGGDIFAAALYHYLPAAAKLYSQGKLNLNLKPGQLFPNNKTLVNADKDNPTFGQYLDRFKKELLRQKQNNVFEQGGENNNNMKIRIIEAPEQMAEGGEPKYSGQSDYGLYIGQRNLYNTMAKNQFSDAGNSVKEENESPENPYVLEAEGGESILRPDGTHMKINGDRHFEGGVKLTKDQAPEGSFIYSDTKKMKIKDPNILQHFGKTSKKGGITPAEIAKQYDVNKYLGVLKDPNADKLSKKTAELMVNNYQRKLAELALVQESKKGFPNGIPEVAKSVISAATENMEQAPMAKAKFGGLTKYQYKGQVSNTRGVIPYANAENSNIPNLSDIAGIKEAASYAARKYNLPNWWQYWTKSNTPEGSKSPAHGYPSTYPATGTPSYDDYEYWRERYGKDFEGSTDEDKRRNFQKYMFEELQKNNPNVYKHIMENWGQTKAGTLNDAIFGARTAYGVSSRIPTTTTTTTTVPPSVITTTTVPPAEETKVKNIQVPNIPVPASSKEKAQWTNIDTRNFLNAGLDYASIKKYHPYAATIQPTLPEFIPQDWRGYAATLQSGANKAAEQLGTYQPGQSMASNLSFLAGQQAGQLGDYIGKVDQYNAAGASNMDAQRANILNQFTQYNAANRDKNFAEENVYDDRYRAAERLGRKGILKTWNQADENAAKIYNLNQVESPYYTMDPRTQLIKFNPEGGKAAWEASMRSGNDKDDVERYASNINRLNQLLQGLPAEDRRAYISGYTGSKGPLNKKTSVTTNPITSGNKTTETTYDRDGNPLTLEKYGGNIGASFVKSVSDWYDKLSYIANPKERQRLAEAYASKMHFGK